MTPIIIISTLLAIAGAANAVMDTLAHHYSTSVFRNKNELFWNPAKSWRNKYKDGLPSQGEKFFLSTTLFVALTDAWHLFKFVMLNAYTLAASLAVWGATYTNYKILILIFIAAKILQSGPFNLLYKTILRTPHEQK